MVVFGTSDAKIYYTIGYDELIKVKKNKTKTDHVYHILNSDGSFDLIPKSYETTGNFLNISTDNSIKIAGHYDLLLNNKKVKGLTYNYNRTESNLSHYSAEYVNQFLKEMNLKNIKLINSNNEFLSESLREQNLGKRLINLFLIFALFFLLTEIVLIRFMK